MDYHGRSEWFETPVVVRKILQNFQLCDILDLSLVNKLWNYEAACVLKARGNVVARIGNRMLEEQGAFLAHPFKCIATNDQLLDAAEIPVDVRRIQRTLSYACEDLSTLAGMLELKKTHPFTGLWVSLNANHFGPCEPVCESDFHIINARVPMTYLRIEISYDDNESLGRGWRGNCEAMSSLDLILKDHAHQLVQLELLGWPGFCFRENFPSISIGFPLLQIFLWIHDEPGNHSDNDLLKEIIANAPNLQELHSFSATNENFDLLEFLCSALEDSKAVLAASRATSVSAARFFTRLAVRHEYVLFLSDDIVDARDFEARRAVLRNSGRTLLHVELNTLFFTQIVMDRIPFSRLSRLQLHLKLSYLRREYPALLKIMFGRGLFGRMFPRLEFLCLTDADSFEDPDPNFMTEVLSDHDVTNFISRDQDREKFHSCLVSLSDLLRMDCSLRLDEMEFLEDIHARRLLISRIDHSAPWVWHFSPSTQLLHLFINADDLIDALTLDSVLCGVHPEEVEVLRRKDTEYLKSVHIVPVRPPITYLKSLTQLDMNFAHRQEIHPPSKVSAALCFDRMPGLLINAEEASAMQVEELETVREEFPKLLFFLSRRRY